jgi:hypothetical protein
MSEDWYADYRRQVEAEFWLRREAATPRGVWCQIPDAPKVYRIIRPFCIEGELKFEITPVESRESPAHLVFEYIKP